MVLCFLRSSRWASASPRRVPSPWGSKIDTEGSVLAQIVRLMLEANDFTVNDRSGFGTTSVVREALLAGEIDLYPEYTGTALTFFPNADLPEGVSTDAEELYNTVEELDLEQNNVVWLDRAPANNTWAIAVPETLAQENELSDHRRFGALHQRGGRVQARRQPGICGPRRCAGGF